MGRGPKRWWHFVLPRQFWFVYVLGGGYPQRKHGSRRSAEREAVRLSRITGLPVYVLKADSVVLPTRPPEPDFAMVDLDSGMTMWWANTEHDV